MRASLTCGILLPQRQVAIFSGASCIGGFSFLAVIRFEFVFRVVELFMSQFGLLVSTKLPSGIHFYDVSTVKGAHRLNALS